MKVPLRLLVILLWLKLYYQRVFHSEDRVVFQVHALLVEDLSHDGFMSFTSGLSTASATSIVSTEDYNLPGYVCGLVDKDGGPSCATIDQQGHRPEQGMVSV